jgi:hypothetical protein
MIKKPSVKTLARAFGDKASEARKIIEMSQSEILAAGPGNHFDRARHIAKVSICCNDLSLQMSTLNALGGFHGTQYIQAKSGEYARYLNSGETYHATLIYWRGRYRVQSVGDFIETMERQNIHFK